MSMLSAIHHPATSKITVLWGLLMRSGYIHHFKIAACIFDQQALIDVCKLIHCKLADHSKTHVKAFLNINSSQ